MSAFLYLRGESPERARAQAAADALGRTWSRQVGLLITCTLLLASWIAGLHAIGFSPLRIVAGLWRLWDIAGLMLPPSPGSWGRFWIYIDALGQTLAIALLGTMLGALVGAPFGFLAARNIVANRVLHWLVRRGLDTVRSVDALIWALIWINVVGLGPFSGVLAIASADCAAFAKLVSEMIEGCDRKPIEGIVAAGGGTAARLRFGIVPQVLPVVISQVLYFFESNTRSATIIGVVGAGGIGLWLSESIRVLEWQQTAFLIVIVLLAVIVIDAISWRIRRAVLGRS